MLRIEDNKGWVRGNDRQKIYLFECSECGCEIKAAKSRFGTHSGKCRSCVQKSKPYEAVYNEMKHHGNKEVSMTYEEFLQVIEDGKCHYCGCEVTVNKHVKDQGKDLSRAYHLDRMNNNMGYQPGNCVLCCWRCNRLKSDVYTYEEFMKLSPILKEIHSSR